MANVSVTTLTGTTVERGSSTEFHFGEGLFSPGANCPLGCGGPSVVLTDGRVFSFGGSGNSTIYVPVNGTWTVTEPCSNLPGPGGPESCGSSSWLHPTVLSGAPSSCGANCGKVLVSGGFGPTNNLPNKKTAFLFDPVTMSWQRTADMVLPRVNHTAALLPDGTVLVAGGCQIRRSGCGPSGGIADTGVEIFNAATETWTATTPMNSARSYHPMVVLDPKVGPCGNLCGRVMVIGGVNTGAPQTSVEAYDPIGKTWSVHAPLADWRYWNPAVQAGGGVLVLGGYNRSGDTSDYFDVATGEWTHLTEMAYPSGPGGRATRLGNGKVFNTNVGGQLFDPGTRKLTSIGPAM